MLSLLIIDDEEELLGLARHFLGTREGIDLATSSSATGGLALHQARTCDAIVVDLNMPGMDGIEFLRNLRSTGDTTPLIILTGRGSEQGAMEALNLGADFYLTKGGDPEVLFAELARIVEFSVKTHRMEKSLREREQRYRTIFEIAGSATAILDEKGTIILANHEAMPILGYSPAELEGKVNWSAFIPRDELPRLNEYWRLIFTDPARSSQRFEARFQDRWGAPRVGIIAAKLVPGTRNVVISITDITELKRAEEKIRVSENLYRTIFRTTGTATVILDEHGTVLLANGEVEPLLGFAPGELEGKAAWPSFIPPDELPRLSEFFRLLHEDPASSTQHYEARLLDRWGETKHGAFSVALIPGTRHSVMSVMDITGLKRTGDALRESEEKYRTLVEQAGDGILVIQDEIIRFANSRAAEIWGGTPEGLTGKRFAELLDPGEMEKVLGIHHARLAGKPVPPVYDTVINRKDGTSVHLAIHAGLITYVGAPATLAFIRDITERKRREEELLTAHRKLNLLSSITRHDIRNQLMVILGYTELLRQEAGESAAVRIITAVEEAARTIQHHIDFTREYQELGIQAPVWQDAREAILRASGRFSFGKVRLAIDLEKGIELFADPLLERAFYNLIGNALGHGETLTRIRFSASESDAGLTIRCDDDGVGIPAQDRERIFSPGFSRTSSYGLFLVREILGITGISIHEQGEEGKGASFRLMAPRGTYRFRK